MASVLIDTYGCTLNRAITGITVGDVAQAKITYNSSVCLFGDQV